MSTDETPAGGVPFPETLAAFQENPMSLLWRIPGIWPVNKPTGPSSNLIVVRARKILGIKRLGHAGTLDPLASGLLLLLAGNAARLFDHMQEMTKSYTARFRLGERRDSQDVTGTRDESYSPTARPPLPRDAVEAVLPRFTGDILQTPPMHSALKKDGTPLYKLARQGLSVPRSARPVTIHELRLTEFDGVEGSVDMTVSKGTYVRTVIDDIGLALGAGAYMTELTRTATGPYRLAEAVTLEELAEKNAQK